MKKVKEFFGNIKQEWDKITWPTSKEMKQGTIQVFVFMIALSLFFAGVDAVVSAGVATANNEPDPIVEIVETDEDADDVVEEQADEADDAGAE